MNGSVTDKYRNEKEEQRLAPLPDNLISMSDGIHALIQHVYDNTVGIEIENGNKTKIETNNLNDNFYKQEFLKYYFHEIKYYLFFLNVPQDF